MTSDGLMSAAKPAGPRTVVISQPMLFPWVGMFEQIRLADVYVHYDDVQYSKGSFTNRVQIKTGQGIQWLTVPVKARLEQTIRDTPLQDDDHWRRKHLALLTQALAKAPYRDEMLDLVNEVYRSPADNIADFSASSMEAICRYFGFDRDRQYVWSSQLGIPGQSTERVLAVVQRFAGERYVTGHGAAQYFDHELADSLGISVEYMQYQKTPYRQLHGEFTPYVSILDLIANEGQAGVRFIHSPCQHWRAFLPAVQKDAA